MRLPRKRQNSNFMHGNVSLRYLPYWGTIFKVTPSLTLLRNHRHGLPHLNVHGLRHTSAAYLIGQGMDLQTVSGRLGHVKISTTTDIYGHFLESKDKKAADLIERSFGKKKEKKKTKKDLA